MSRLIANNVAIQVKSSGSSPTLQSKSVTSGSSAQTVYPDSGYDSLYSVQIYPSILQNQSISFKQCELSLSIGQASTEGSCDGKVYWDVSLQNDIQSCNYYLYYYIALMDTTNDYYYCITMGNFFQYYSSSDSPFCYSFDYVKYNGFIEMGNNGYSVIETRKNSSVGITITKITNSFFSFSGTFSIIGKRPTINKTLSNMQAGRGFLVSV